MIPKINNQINQISFQIEHINSVDSKGRSALHAAVSCDSVECVQILLNNGGMNHD